MASSSGIDAENSGSTAVMGLLQGKQLTTAWVGDSRGVLGYFKCVRASGRAHAYVCAALFSFACGAGTRTCARAHCMQASVRGYVCLGCVLVCVLAPACRCAPV